MITALSALYAKLFVLLGLAFPVTEALATELQGSFYQVATVGQYSSTACTWRYINIFRTLTCQGIPNHDSPQTSIHANSANIPVNK